MDDGRLMGRTLGDWLAKVANLIRDEEGEDVGSIDIEAIGLYPALAQFSVDRPRQRYAEVAGSGVSYFALPTGWIDGFSQLQVEFPARQNPPLFLDEQSVRLVGSLADPSVQQILLLTAAPGPTQYVRFSYTTPWPYPDSSDPAVDQVSDIAFEAVAALAASFCCVALSGQAARSRVPAMANEVIPEGSRAASLLEAAKMYRSVYDSFVGLGSSLTGATGTQAPAYGRLDYDPRYYSLFHGGRR